ncbi:MAG: hypothetical protein Q9163_002573 [Psora crenata]
MRVLQTLVIALETFSFATVALPIGYGQRQEPLSLSPQLQPASVRSETYKFSFRNPFKAAKKQTSTFRCYGQTGSSVLAGLANYITQLLKSYSDELFDCKGGPDRIPFELCMGGYKGDDVSPSIYFKEMTRRQLEKMEKISRNQVLNVFPNLTVVMTEKGLALVQEKTTSREMMG